MPLKLLLGKLRPLRHALPILKPALFLGGDYYCTKLTIDTSRDEFRGVCKSPKHPDAPGEFILSVLVYTKGAVYIGYNNMPDFLHLAYLRYRAIPSFVLSQAPLPVKYWHFCVHLTILKPQGKCPANHSLTPRCVQVLTVYFLRLCMLSISGSSFLL